MTIKLGMEAKLYRNTATYATPTWSEITNARDVTLNLEAGEADASRRGGGGWRETLQALKDGNIEFEMLFDSSDAAFTALRDAFFNNTPLDVLALEGDVATSGNEGLRMVCAVTNFSRNEPLEETLTVNVTLKPTPNADSPPVWFTAA